MNHELIRLLKHIKSAANGLEVFSHSAVASMNGAYGDEDADYTRCRVDDVLMMLRSLEVFHGDLKREMERQS